ncbi:MAG: hypothetical protein FJ296_05075 [Planctomycetes bacterium]|nr:hypothetical protein [Planctomycetota bacterium]
MRHATTLLLCILLALPAAAQHADGGSVESAILDILLARGIITADEHAELLALARAQADARAGEVELVEARLQRLRAPDVQATGGTPGKLVFRSADGTWSLGLRGRIQARVENLASDDDSRDDTNFSVPRGRLVVEGQSGAPQATYKLELDVSTQKNPSDPASGKDASLDEGWINWAFDAQDNLRLGQLRFPFSRESHVGTSVLSLAERSLANQEFAADKEPGALLWGTLDEGAWEWFLAVSNGEGKRANNTSGSDRNGLRRGARLVWNPLGPFRPEGPAFVTLDDGGERLALGASWMRNDDSSGTFTVTPGSDTETSGLELQAFSGPWSLMADAYARRELRAGPDVEDRGSTLQLGRLFDEGTWELVARTSSVDLDTEDDQREHVLGFNWYVARHAGKWLVELGRLRGSGDAPDERRLRVQYQLQF